MAFYNEFRPRKFSEIVGHKRAVSILRHQALSQSFHHAYLFSGFSGSGKTTCARILSAALCCPSLDGMGEPCGDCISCRGIFSGQCWDFFELDAARYRGVEDIETILGRVHLFPLGKVKIYLIDECHMLSEAAWSCLLKTLEEPPPYFVMILCTTEPKKIAETVVSRCHTVHFERLTDTEVQEKLDYICGHIGFSIPSSRLQYILGSAKGNLRTAETLLEQVYTEYVAESIQRARSR